jgi:general secretion pathway protein I
MKRRGFTLLEVLVAVSILGLGLTTILSSQVGLFSSASHGQNLTYAVGLARCRMNETELELLKNGLPLIDQSDEGPCCEDEDQGRFRCSWKIETIELPEASAIASADGGAELNPTDTSALDKLSSLQGGLDGGVGSLTDLMAGGESGGGMGDMAAMAMGMVYPTLKPMFEASIRKVTVTVEWKEGSNDRELSVTQFVTNPQQGGLDQQGGGLGDLLPQLQGLVPDGGAP